MAKNLGLSRVARIAGVIVYIPLFTLPLIFHHHWLAGAVVAWAILSAVLAAFAAVIVEVGREIVLDAAPAKGKSPPAPKAELPDERPSWSSSLKYCLSAGAILFVLIFLLCMMADGFGAFTKSIDYQIAGVFASILVVMWLLIWRYGFTTKADVKAQVARRRARRHGRPRDLALLGQATPQLRRHWLVMARRRARRTAWFRLGISIPAIILAVTFGADTFSALPSSARIVIAIAGVLAGAAIAATMVIRSQRDDPLLLVGRITEGLNGVEIVGGKAPGIKEKAWTYVTLGAWHKISIEIERACRIRADGSIYSAPTWHGETELGACRRLHRRGIEGEKAVIISANEGPAVGLLGDLIGRPTASQRR